MTRRPLAAEDDARLQSIVIDPDGFEYAPHEEQPETEVTR